MREESERPGQVKIVFFPYGKREFFPKGEVTVLDAAKALGIDLSSLCGGKGTCGKCKVRIDKGLESLGPLTEQELKHLTEEEIKSNYRIACQIRPTTSIVIYVPERSRIGKQRLQTEGLEVPVKKLNPFVKKYLIELPQPTLHDTRSDEDRLLTALHEKYGLPIDLNIDFDLSLDLATILRKEEWTVTATVWNNKEIVDVQPGDTTSRCFGFATDIGTTKLAGFLMDLNSGKVVSVAARMNPQIPLGEEVMTRITHQIMEGWDGVKELQTAVVGGINEMIAECCETTKVDPSEIYELCFVGNTAMQLCFLGIYGRYVAYSPYPPVLRRGVNVRAPKLGLKANPRANTYFAPVIGGFVGADNVAVILATRMLERDEICMALDIGTNTEIDLGNKDLVLTDSCASGPAFEGMQIKHGMRAATGSIERVSIDPDTYEVTYRTIEDKPAIGFCGSALVDIPAELLKSGLIDLTGRFVTERAKQTNRMRKSSEGIWEFVIAWQPDTATDTDIVISQGDIRELQKAKAAMRTGAGILMKRLGVTEKDLSKLFMAGAFGNYIDPENARTIGMYPELPLEKVTFVGNIAGTGSRMCLTSQEERDYAERISKTVKYYELAADEDFQTEYINAMYFPHKDLSKYPDTVDLLRRLGRIK
jgi:uncharacterized 2Fe-2S/4Fe-4S cluster protein (DUF4445 family)